MSIAATCCWVFKKLQAHRQDLKAANGDIVFWGGNSYTREEKYLTVSLANKLKSVYWVGMENDSRYFIGELW